jgi:hypothetical protein
MSNRFYNFNIPKSNKVYNPVQSFIQALVVVLVFAFIVDYVTLPAYNIHNSGFLFLLVFYILIFGTLYATFSHRFDFIVKGSYTIAFVIVVATFVLSFLSSEFLNASKYRDQITIKESENFSAEFDAITLNKIPLVDQNTAAQLGDKQIGRVQGLGSQFNISNEYMLINVNDSVYRVSSLEYQDFYKWLQNREVGIPSYISVNVNDPSDVELVDLAFGMKFAPSAFFNEDLLRHVRFSYRTEMFESVNFEIDDMGNPYYIVTVKEPSIGWFGGWDTEALIVVDAVSGDMNKYAVEDAPTWVDHIQSANLAWYQIDNWGYYINGWFNTLFGQKEMIQTTDGYNFVSIDEQIYIFSGLTSVGSDRSIVGFALINLRTKEATFIKVGGADEYSAMNSAIGQVQHLNYTSTFPLLLNVEGLPTYFMALKDNEGLVKLYAMVSVQDYSVVGVAATVELTQSSYVEQLMEKGLITGAVLTQNEMVGTISTIVSTIINGTTHYYFTLEGSNILYTASSDLSVELALSQVLDPVKIQVTKLSDNIMNVITYDNLNYDY